MQMVIVKYISLFCFALFFGNNINCDKLMLQREGEDTQIYETSVCMLRRMANNENFTSSYQSCSTVTNNTLKSPIRMTPNSWSVELVCRNESNLIFRISNSPNQKKSWSHHINGTNDKIKKIFILKMHVAFGGPTEQRTYLTNSSLINISNLESNTKYNISVVAVHDTNHVSIITKESQFTTLPTKYTPGKVQHIRVEELIREGNKTTMTAIVTWEPAEDRTCYYNIVSFSPLDNENVGFTEIRQPEDLYMIEIEKVAAGIQLEVKITGVRYLGNDLIEGDAAYDIFDTQSCLKLTDNDLTLCAPEVPSGLHAELTHEFDNVFSMNITWKKPTVEPDFYTLRILDLNRNMKNNAPRVTINISKAQTSIFRNDLIFNGDEYEVHLTASSIGGNSSSFIANPIPMIKEIFKVTRLVIVVVVPIMCMIVVALLVLLIFHRRAKLKRYQVRCKYFEELEKKAPVDPNSNFEISKISQILPSKERLNLLQQELENKLYINDGMEIDRDNVFLLDEILGEGAFGLVRKGLVKLKDGIECEVAVKMLKDKPFIDDIKEFHREIEVMKFVGAHPNIVGIIGHCTRNANEMLLLTEYCSQGNLLLYLRAEWHYQSKLSTNSDPDEECTTPTLLNNKKSECIFNFDTSLIDKTSISYKNINDNKLVDSELADTTKPMNTDQNLIGPTQFIINKSYDYNGFCTSSCKCQVDIKPNNECLKTNEFDCNKNNIKIDVKSCQCRLKLKSSTDELSEQILLENHGYKCLIADHQDQLNSVKPDAAMKDDQLTSGDLLRMAKQIALGMDFLSKNKVVHRDLAARNVLVCENKTVKIADFGLSRDIYQENIYKKTGNGKLPIKWLALESMTHQVYTTQSDVWSYGILLYEIVTLGGTPYPLVSTNRLLKYLKTGQRMEKPRNCNETLYDLMKSCWCSNPNERPTFSDLCHAMDDLLSVKPEDQIINFKLMEHYNRLKSSSEESYLKPI